ncbi:hypothetical protein R5R35_003799 [Gryllus longicercus]|uniref:Uncharacterized protein n=1 Tax=Gryllus longicercus TaxID=2509291 RepID=A0AAN9Z329_9ORTH
MPKYRRCWFSNWQNSRRRDAEKKDVSFPSDPERFIKWLMAITTKPSFLTMEDINKWCVHDLTAPYLLEKRVKDMLEVEFILAMI